MMILKSTICLNESMLQSIYKPLFHWLIICFRPLAQHHRLIILNKFLSIYTITQKIFKVLFNIIFSIVFLTTL